MIEKNYKLHTILINNKISLEDSKKFTIIIDMNSIMVY